MINTRLAKIVAQCTDKNGAIDRERFYEALMIDPKDPITLVIESFLAQDSTARELREANRFLIEQVDDRLGILRDQLAKHKDTVSAAGGEIGKMLAEGQGDLRAEVTRFEDALVRQNKATANLEKTASRLTTAAFALAGAAVILAVAAVAGAMLLKH
jgi:hypothetical protein